MRTVLHSGLVSRVSAGAVIALLLASSTGSAYGTTFGSKSCDTTYDSQCVANNGDHAVYFGTPEINKTTADMQWVLDNVYNPIRDISAWNTADASIADVRYYDYEFGLNGIYGWTTCASGAAYGGSYPSRWCKPQNLNLNISYSAVYDTQTERRSIACHELGHTLGLQHAPDWSTCMYDGYYVSTWINAHEVDHINAQY